MLNALERGLSRWGTALGARTLVLQEKGKVVGLWYSVLEKGCAHHSLTDGGAIISELPVTLILYFIFELLQVTLYWS